MSRGIVYYNSGTSCIIRLITSVYSLRKVYAGSVTIVSEGDESRIYCKPICEHFGVDFVNITLDIPEGKNRALLAKPKAHLYSPYDTTLLLDNDTIVLKEINTIFSEIEKHSFVLAQIANWTTRQRNIIKRLLSLRPYHPELLPLALRQHPAINCGVVGFTKSAEMFESWYDRALKARDVFIPDEVCAQALLPRVRHFIMDQRYNTSCKYGKIDDQTAIVHYHGKKHCRMGTPIPFNGDIWVRNYIELLTEDTCSINGWGTLGDRQLERWYRLNGPRYMGKAAAK